MYEWLQPIVLVGGKSRRFGRDKLSEPLCFGDRSEWLVDAPIRALRGVFGSRVALVGHCSPPVAARGDLCFPDRYPGVGPIGGVLSALEASEKDVFILAGDLPLITAEVVQSIVEAGGRAPAAWAVLAGTGRVEPCIGIYRREAAPGLAKRVVDGQFALVDAVGADRTVIVEVPSGAVINVNTQEVLKQVGQGR